MQCMTSYVVQSRIGHYIDWVVITIFLWSTACTYIKRNIIVLPCWWRIKMICVLNGNKFGNKAYKKMHYLA